MKNAIDRRGTFSVTSEESKVEEVDQKQESIADGAPKVSSFSVTGRKSKDKLAQV